MNPTRANIKNSILLIGITIMAVLFLNGCSKSNSNPTPTSKLSITALSVNSGPYTTAVTLTGIGFSNTAILNQVFFNGVAASELSVNSSGTSLSVAVPLAAGTGNVTIKVNGVTATGPVFTYKPAEVVSLLAGGGAGYADGTGSNAAFWGPSSIVTDAAGNVYVADQQNRLIRKVTPAGVVTTFAGSGQIGYADGQGTSASFNKPFGLAIDGTGNIYVSDEINNLIRKITPTGLVSTIAGNLTSRSTDGTGTTAGFSNPTALAVDASGNVFVADQGSGEIRKITPANVVTTIYTNNNISPYGLALDKSGNIYITGNYEILKITQTGVASVFAGSGNAGEVNGTGTTASFYNALGIAFDNSGNMFVTDQNFSAIREITPAQVVTTFTGSGAYSVGPLAQVTFAGLEAITIDASNNIYVIESNQIEKIAFE